MSDSSTFNNFHYGFIWRNLLSLDEKWIVSGAEGFLEVYKKFKKSSIFRVWNWSLVIAKFHLDIFLVIPHTYN